MFFDALARIAGAIVLDLLAFAIWNVGARTPLGVLRDARRALGDARSLFTGVARAAIGLVFVCAAAVLALPALADPSRDFTPIEALTVLVALALDVLVGDDLRALAGGPEAARR